VWRRETHGAISSPSPCPRVAAAADRAIEDLGTRLKLINIVTIPLVLTLAALFASIISRRRIRTEGR
jgi:hypothetical protein